MPANYGRLLTTFPVYSSTYVLVYRNDKGLDIKGLDDPQLKDLKIGVFQTSGIREALAKRGIVDNVSLQCKPTTPIWCPSISPGGWCRR